MEFNRQLNIMKNMQFSNKPLVSIIMNCYNGESYLTESIKSVLSQTYQNWELIFWDNLSTDKSREILEGFSDKRIKYFKANNFTKLYEARNLAISKSTGQLISILDVDDWWSPKKIESQIKYFENKDIGLVYSKYIVYNEKSKKKTLVTKKELPQGDITKQLLKNYQMGVITIMFRKELLSRFNLNFNPIYNIIGDFDFNIRLSQKVKCACVQEPLAFHRIHGENYSLKNLNEEVDELENWIKSQIDLYKNSEEDFIKIKELIQYKKIFINISKNQRYVALKKFIKYPNNQLKLKLLVLLISPLTLLRKFNLLNY